MKREQSKDGLGEILAAVCAGAVVWCAVAGVIWVVGAIMGWRA